MKCTVKKVVALRVGMWDCLVVDEAGRFTDRVVPPMRTKARRKALENAMTVRAINVAKSATVSVAKFANVDELAKSVFANHVAACTAALLDNNRGEAARAFARARHAHCDMGAVQSRCFDAGVSGALLRQAFTLSKDIGPDSLSKGNAALATLSEGVREARKTERDAKASAPLKVPMFAGLIVR